MFNHAVKLLNYDQHTTLLISTATNYDLQFVSSSSRNTRKVHNIELGDSDSAIDSPADVTEDADYDIDASIATFFSKHD